MARRGWIRDWNALFDRAIETNRTLPAPKDPCLDRGMKSRIGLLPFILCFAICASGWAKPGPNILFIYTDDQAAWALGASGNKQAFTPNLDKLAGESAMFSNAFVVTPVCSPSRIELMTSRYGTETGVVDFLVMPNHSRLDYDPSHGLRKEVVTFPEVLSAAGYQTALVGKWHLGQEAHFHPLQHGYQYFAGFLEGGTVAKDPILEIDGKPTKRPGLTVDVLTAEAERFLKQRDATRPFMLSLHYRAPHGPFKPVAPEDYAPYDGLDLKLPHPDYPDLNIGRVKRMMGDYLALVRSIDRNVGRLMKLLRKERLDRNTIVIFTSDHGYNMGHNGIHHKGNGIWATKKLPPARPDIEARYRPNLYDQSMRVPLLVRWPGVTKAGQQVEDVVSNLDWFPTLIRMAGAAVPKGVLVRGRDFSPLLRGRDVAWDQSLYGEYSMINYGIADMRCLRTQEWKLVVDFHNRKRDELYDLRSDPGETTNLINDRSAAVVSVKRSLLKELLRRKRQVLSGRP
jgi:arylsulfatase A-like enzyme